MIKYLRYKMKYERSWHRGAAIQGRVTCRKDEAIGSVYLIPKRRGAPLRQWGFGIQLERIYREL